MRLKRLFKRTEPADPFAAFAQTYGIRIPHDSPPPKAEPAEPQPHDASPPKAEPAEPQPVEPQPAEPGPMRAHQVLGVPLGALGHEVSQAHRKLALMHHPDRMASMGPEAEEYSEERMKEINAAYEELRRRGA